MDGPQSCFGRGGEEKNSQPPPEIDEEIKNEAIKSLKKVSYLCNTMF